MTVITTANSELQCQGHLEDYFKIRTMFYSLQCANAKLGVDIIINSGNGTKEYIVRPPDDRRKVVETAGP